MEKEVKCLIVDSDVEENGPKGLAWHTADVIITTGGRILKNRWGSRTPSHSFCRGTSDDSLKPASRDLRDQFAMAALTGLARETPSLYVAKECYEIAAQMMKERDKRDKEEDRADRDYRKNGA